MIISKLLISLCLIHHFCNGDQTESNIENKDYFRSRLENYLVAFPFSIDGRQFFFAQHIDSSKLWYIQELLPGGKFGDITDRGSFNHRFTSFVAFPFLIEGRHFFYAHDTSGLWYIQELLRGGIMGLETDRGRWRRSYHVTFPFSIDGRQFFYGHNIVSDKNWFIQELLPGGKMGYETDTGKWWYKYHLAFPFSIDGKQFFYGQKHSGEGSFWFTQELLPKGKMGWQKSWGRWSFQCQVAFPFSINGSQFFFAQNTVHQDEKNWFIHNLLPNGKMGYETDNGLLKSGYEAVFPFSINNRHFYFRQDFILQHQIIRELLPNGKLGSLTDSGGSKGSY